MRRRRVVHEGLSGTRLERMLPNWIQARRTMHGMRAIMSRIFYYAEGHGLWEEGRRSPASKAKLGKKRH